MTLFKATILVLLAGAALYVLLWRIGGGPAFFLGIMVAALMVFAAYYWLALKD